MRTINNAYSIWCSDWQLSICSLDGVQIHPINNATIRKITIWKNKLAKKSYNENILHQNILKPSVIQIFVYLTSIYVFNLIKFDCIASSFVPNIEAKSVVLELNTRDNEHCFRFLLLHDENEIGVIIMGVCNISKLNMNEFRAIIYTAFTHDGTVAMNSPSLYESEIRRSFSD